MAILVFHFFYYSLCYLLLWMNEWIRYLKWVALRLDNHYNEELYSTIVLTLFLFSIVFFDLFYGLYSIYFGIFLILTASLLSFSIYIYICSIYLYLYNEMRWDEIKISTLGSGEQKKGREGPSTRCFWLKRKFCGEKSGTTYYNDILWEMRIYYYHRK